MRIHREEKTMPTERLITVESSFPHEETVQRLEAAVREGGMTPFAHVDHSAGAAGVGLVLRPTQVLIFGNPRAGILLIQDNQKIGIDLPLRALIWQDDRDRTWVSYIEPAEIAKQYGITNREDLLSKMGQSVKLAVERATKV
jgi:uncharacterized protein (DUF302 family)